MNDESTDVDRLPGEIVDTIRELEQEAKQAPGYGCLPGDTDLLVGASVAAQQKVFRLREEIARLRVKVLQLTPDDPRYGMKIGEADKDVLLKTLLEIAAPLLAAAREFPEGTDRVIPQPRFYQLCEKGKEGYIPVSAVFATHEEAEEAMKPRFCDPSSSAVIYPCAIGPAFEKAFRAAVDFIRNNERKNENGE